MCVMQKPTKARAKAGTKRKASSKGTSRGGRKVKVVSDTEEGNEPSKEQHDEVCVCVCVCV